MDGAEDWNAFLKDHPIFKSAKGKHATAAKEDASFELSLSSLPDFTTDDLDNNTLTPSGRRQVMVIKDYELILAVGSEIRMASLGDVKSSRSGVPEQKTYKILNTPNVGFDIHQMVMNPNGKFLAVAGAFHVTVVLLPRPGFTRLVPDVVDCKSISIGQNYHALGEAPIAKIDWHPWGNGGTTLLVMTVNGKLREYDIAVDIEEPQQVLSFVPEKKSRSYVAEDETEREVASFTLGRGKADWGPLSIYGVMKSGDIYAICPYMPQNALVPSSYVHALECFVAAKQEFLTQSEDEPTPSSSSGLTTVYDYQRKYVNALLKQLPPGTAFPSAPRMVLMHPPPTIRGQPVRQGPFLLQPAPRSLEGSEGGDATDIIYLAFGAEGEENNEGEGETERLGVVLVVFQDGKVDLFLDVEKVEARWERKHSSKNRELPMLAVYESIDLGLLSTLSQISPRDGEPPILELLRGNHPVLTRDPINDETIYVYHAFGVHAIQLGTLLQKLANALRDDVSNDGEDSLGSSLEAAGGATVKPLVTTFSVEQRCSYPVTAVAIPDVYLTYSIFVLTSAMRVVTIPLTLQSEMRPPDEEEYVSDPNAEIRAIEKPSDGPPAYVSLLAEPYKPPTKFTNDAALPSNPKLVVPVKGEIQLTPDTMRYLASTIQHLTDQMHEIQIAYRSAELRAQLQEQEFRRQQSAAKDILALNDALHGERQEQTREKVSQVQARQKELLNRTDRILRAMMKSASPELSEHETKWFEELKRLQSEIKGSTRYDQESLSGRITHLRKELDRLLPSLKELKQKEQRIQKRLSEVHGSSGIGATQAFEFGLRSSKERARIDSIEADVLKLAAKLDMTLARPPSTQPSEPSEKK
ncbi:hypothetical protein BDY19DRAFT_883645 [Irpex rosettiformis]|uniref:Uncharacterized protein n=1 Tax=Irpex rosettiformis TaxID=378272 RepID=A0ACB8UE39_9APHY|nr:hypothetical protein BDY19DRAFT_883645 [Irpex rosettiformis]